MKKKLTTTVYLWSFIFAIAIHLTYLNSYFWNEHDNVVFNGGFVLSFFMFLFGYVLIKKYKDNDEKKEGDAASKTWKYTFNNIKDLYPYLFSGVLIAFIVRNIINGTKIWQLFGIIMDSLWEFFGLSQIGAVGFNSTTSLTFDNIAGYSHLWNQSLWIISALIIVGLFIYYIVAKSEEFFKGIFAPLMVVVTYALFGVGNVSMNELSQIGIPYALIRVAGGICAGALDYYLAEYFKKKKFSETMRMLFSVLHIMSAVFFLYTLFAGFEWSVLTHGLAMFIFFVVLVTDKDYVSDLYDNSNACIMFGNVAKIYYILFLPIMFAITNYFPNLSYELSILINLLFTISISFVIFLIKNLINNLGK